MPAHAFRIERPVQFATVGAPDYRNTQAMADAQFGVTVDIHQGQAIGDAQCLQQREGILTKMTLLAVIEND